jgi:hypothetical protein
MTMSSGNNSRGVNAETSRIEAALAEFYDAYCAGDSALQTRVLQRLNTDLGPQALQLLAIMIGCEIHASAPAAARDLTGRVVLARILAHEYTPAEIAEQRPGLDRAQAKAMIAWSAQTGEVCQVLLDQIAAGHVEAWKAVAPWQHPDGLRFLLYTIVHLTAVLAAGRGGDGWGKA